jgi:hypothetical protein
VGRVQPAMRQCMTGRRRSTSSQPDGTDNRSA